jgi:hypothetical protein
MIAVGFLLILVGFAVITPRSGRSESARGVSIGRQWWLRQQVGATTGTPLQRYRLIRVLGGLAMIVGGFVILAKS